MPWPRQTHTHTHTLRRRDRPCTGWGNTPRIASASPLRWREHSPGRPPQAAARSEAGAASRCARPAVHATSVSDGGSPGSSPGGYQELVSEPAWYQKMSPSSSTTRCQPLTTRAASHRRAAAWSLIAAASRGPLGPLRARAASAAVTAAAAPTDEPDDALLDARCLVIKPLRSPGPPERLAPPPAAPPAAPLAEPAAASARRLLSSPPVWLVRQGSMRSPGGLVLPLPLLAAEPAREAPDDPADEEEPSAKDAVPIARAREVVVRLVGRRDFGDVLPPGVFPVERGRRGWGPELLGMAGVDPALPRLTWLPLPTPLPPPLPTLLPLAFPETDTAAVGGSCSSSVTGSSTVEARGPACLGRSASESSVALLPESVQPPEELDAMRSLACSSSAVASASPRSRSAFFAALRAASSASAV
mmetsp:Transcript_2544/g.10084  ORF Transcript_2544/g.10084 Transcript_2544/m.10084 type:complete len:417 (-) Transcript_2544:889-2139(-)